MPKAAAIFLAASFCLLGCPAEEGLVLVDVCTPAEAADPFLNGTVLRITSTGDVSSSLLFDLLADDFYEREAAYPMGSSISVVVEVLNDSGVAISRGVTEKVEVRPVTRVCACLTLLVESDIDLCREVGCVYEPNTDRCIFYRLP